MFHAGMEKILLQEERHELEQATRADSKCSSVLSACLCSEQQRMGQRLLQVSPHVLSPAEGTVMDSECLPGIFPSSPTPDFPAEPGASIGQAPPQAEAGHCHI